MLKKGFTLIELLVVITIMAILAGTALPYVQNYVEESRVSKARADLEEIARALAVYEAREGEYTKDTVADLTGRYLNKAPIDPWGKPYWIATAAGIVISGGPSRATDTLHDNIQAPYLPPLSLVSVKWLDKNQSGAVDTYNSPDQLQLTFNRMLNGTSVLLLKDDDDDLNATFVFSSNANATAVIDRTTMEVVNSSRTLVFDLIADNVFTPGSDTIRIEAGQSFLKDLADPANLCLTDQNVKILPF